MTQCDSHGHWAGAEQRWSLSLGGQGFSQPPTHSSALPPWPLKAVGFARPTPRDQAARVHPGAEWVSTLGDSVSRPLWETASPPCVRAAGPVFTSLTSRSRFQRREEGRVVLIGRVLNPTPLSQPVTLGKLLSLYASL